MTSSQMKPCEIGKIQIGSNFKDPFELLIYSAVNMKKTCDFIRSSCLKIKCKRHYYGSSPEIYISLFFYIKIFTYLNVCLYNLRCQNG